MTTTMQIRSSLNYYVLPGIFTDKQIAFHKKESSRKEVARRSIMQTILFFNINEKDLIGDSRKMEFVIPRWLCAYVMNLRGVPVEMIADILNYTQHSQVLHGINKIKGMLKDKHYSKEREQVELFLKHYKYTA